jgi:hypothetical protein
MQLERAILKNVEDLAFKGILSTGKILTEIIINKPAF